MEQMYPYRYSDEKGGGIKSFRLWFVVGNKGFAEFDDFPFKPDNCLKTIKRKLNKIKRT